MTNKKSKFLLKAKYILLTVFILITTLFVLRKDIVVLFSHISHRDELIFVKNFLNDLKKSDIEELRNYFLTERNIKVLKLLLKHDGYLQKRVYYIDEIISNFYDEEKKKYVNRSDRACIEISTIGKGKILSWLEIFIIKKKGNYYIEHFQLGYDFPRPPNEY